MTRLIIDTGTVGNTATGDSIRTAMTKINDNFLEVYTDLAASGLGGRLTNENTNGNVIIQPNGTGIVEVDQLLITDDTITSLITNNDLTLSGNGTGGVTVLGNLTAGQLTTNEIVSQGSNADVSIEPSGTGDILLKTDGQVGIGSVGSPDTSLHIKQANAILTLQRTSDANTPGIDFQQSGGNIRAKIFMDGTSGTSKELVFQTHDSSLGERFRVLLGGAKTTGTFEVTGTSTFGDSVTAESLVTNVIQSNGSNADLALSGSGTGEVTTDSNFKLESGTPFVKIQRTDNANVPGIDFIGQAGTSGAKILFDGTSGTSNELIFQTFDGSSLAEAFRVQQSGAKVTGTLNVDGGITITDNKITSAASNANIQIDASGTGAIELLTQKVIMANLPTSDPSNAGQLFNDSGTLKVSAG